MASKGLPLRRRALRTYVASQQYIMIHRGPGTNDTAEGSGGVRGIGRPLRSVYALARQELLSRMAQASASLRKLSSFASAGHGAVKGRERRGGWFRVVGLQHLSWSVRRNVANDTSTVVASARTFATAEVLDDEGLVDTATTTARSIPVGFKLTPKARWYARKAEEGLLTAADLPALLPLLARCGPTTPEQAAAKVADLLTGVCSEVCGEPLLSSGDEVLQLLSFLPELGAVSPTLGGGEEGGYTPHGTSSSVSCCPILSVLLQLKDRGALVAILGPASLRDVSLRICQDVAAVAGSAAALQVVEQLLAPGGTTDVQSQMPQSITEECTVSVLNLLTAPPLGLSSWESQVDDNGDVLMSTSGAAAGGLVDAPEIQRVVRSLLLRRESTASMQEGGEGGSAPWSALNVARLLNRVQLARHCSDPLLKLHCSGDIVEQLGRYSSSSSSSSSPSPPHQQHQPLPVVTAAQVVTADAASRRALVEAFSATFLPAFGQMGLWQEGLRRLVAVQSAVSSSPCTEEEDNSVGHGAETLSNVVRMMLAADCLVQAVLYAETLLLEWQQQIHHPHHPAGYTGTSAAGNTSSSKPPLDAEVCLLMLQHLSRRHSEFDSRYFFRDRVSRIAGLLMAAVEGSSPVAVPAAVKARRTALAASGRWVDALGSLELSDWGNQAGHCSEVLVCAAKGGMPWGVLKAIVAATRSAHGATCSVQMLTRLLHRCAIEVGNWADALKVFQSAKQRPEREMPWKELNHPQLLRGMNGSVRHLPVSPRDIFTPSTLVRAGRWQLAFEGITHLEDLTLEARAELTRHLTGDPSQWRLCVQLLQSLQKGSTPSSPATTTSTMDSDTQVQYEADETPPQGRPQASSSVPTLLALKLCCRLSCQAPPSGWETALRYVAPSTIGDATEPHEQKCITMLLAAAVADVGNFELAHQLLKENRQSSLGTSLRHTATSPTVAAAEALHEVPLRRPSTFTSTLLSRHRVESGRWQEAVSLCLGRHPPAPDCFFRTIWDHHLGVRCVGRAPTDMMIAVISVLTEPYRGRRAYRRNGSCPDRELLRRKSHRVTLSFRVTMTAADAAAAKKGKLSGEDNTEEDEEKAVDVSRLFGAGLRKGRQRSPGPPLAMAATPSSSPSSSWVQGLRLLDGVHGGKTSQATREAVRLLTRVPSEKLRRVQMSIDRLSPERQEVVLSSLLLQSAQGGNWLASLMALECMSKHSISPPLYTLSAFLETQEALYFRGKGTSVQQVPGEEGRAEEDVEGTSSSSSRRHIFFASLNALHRFVGAKMALRSLSDRLSKRMSPQQEAPTTTTTHQATSTVTASSGSTVPAGAGWKEAFELLSIFTAMRLQDVPQPTIQRLLTIPNLSLIHRCLASLQQHQSRTMGLAASETAMAITPGNLEGLLAACQALGLRTNLDLVAVPLPRSPSSSTVVVPGGLPVAVSSNQKSSSATLVHRVMDTSPGCWVAALHLLGTHPIKKPLAEGIVQHVVRETQSADASLLTFHRCFGEGNGSTSFPPRSYPMLQSSSSSLSGLLLSAGGGGGATPSPPIAPVARHHGRMKHALSPCERPPSTDVVLELASTLRRNGAWADSLVLIHQHRAAHHHDSGEGGETSRHTRRGRKGTQGAGGSPSSAINLEHLLAMGESQSPALLDATAAMISSDGEAYVDAARSGASVARGAADRRAALALLIQRLRDGEYLWDPSLGETLLQRLAEV